MIYFQKENQNYQSSFIKISHGFGTKQTTVKLDIISPHQTHSTNISVITSPEQTVIDNCDGLITQLSNITLTVITADCVPMIFYDQTSHIIGISHQGWKGTLHKLPAKMIDEMISLGSQVENIRCAFGPAINDCCYEIYGERLQLFRDEFGESIFRKENEQYFLNLYKANYQSVIRSGISKENIDIFPFCTSCNKQKFWSFYRDHELQYEMKSYITLF